MSSQCAWWPHHCFLDTAGQKAKHSLFLTVGLLWRKCTRLMTHHPWGKDMLRASQDATILAWSRAPIAASKNKRIRERVCSLDWSAPKRQEYQLRTKGGTQNQGYPNRQMWGKLPGTAQIHFQSSQFCKSGLGGASSPSAYEWQDSMMTFPEGWVKTH